MGYVLRPFALSLLLLVTSVVALGAADGGALSSSTSTAAVAAFHPDSASLSQAVGAFQELVALARAHQWRLFVALADLLVTAGLMRLPGFVKLPDEASKWVAAGAGALMATGSYLLTSMSTADAVVMGLTTGPLATLLWEYVIAHWSWLYGLLKRPAPTPVPAPATLPPAPPAGPPAPTAAAILLFAIGAGLTQPGCGGLRAAQMPIRVGAVAVATSSTAAECDALDSRYALWGGVAAATASGSGLSGLTAGLDQGSGSSADAVRLAFGITSVVVAGVSALALFEEHDAEQRWTALGCR